MKRIGWVLIVVLTVVGISYWVWGSQKKDIRADLVLHVEDTGKISQIVILNRQGKKQSFHRQSHYWSNEAGDAVRADAIKNLLTTIHDQRVSGLIPSAAMDNVVKDLSSNSVKIQLLDNNGRDIMSFYVGGVTPDDRGTFMIREESEIPVIVNIPGFEGGLRTRYIMSDRDWQSRELLPELSTVRKLKVDFPRQQEHSFVLKYDQKNNAFVQKLWDVEIVNHHVDIDKLKVYVDRLKNLYAEAVLTSDKIDDLQGAIPFCKLEIWDERDSSYSITFYPQIWIDQKDDTIDHSSVDRYYTYRNDGQLFLTQHLLMQKIFIGYEHFVSSMGSENKM